MELALIFKKYYSFKEFIDLFLLSQVKYTYNKLIYKMYPMKDIVREIFNNFYYCGLIKPNIFNYDKDKKEFKVFAHYNHLIKRIIVKNIMYYNELFPTRTKITNLGKITLDNKIILNDKHIDIYFTSIIFQDLSICLIISEIVDIENWNKDNIHYILYTNNKPNNIELYKEVGYADSINVTKDNLLEL